MFQPEKPNTSQSPNPEQGEIAELTKTIKKMMESFFVKAAERGTRTYDARPKCRRCGRTNHTTVNCRTNPQNLKKPTCFYCQKVGHITKECRKKKYYENERQKQLGQQNSQSKQLPKKGNVPMISKVETEPSELQKEINDNPYDKLIIMGIGNEKNITLIAK